VYTFVKNYPSFYKIITIILTAILFKVLFLSQLRQFNLYIIDYNTRARVTSLRCLGDCHSRAWMTVTHVPG